MELEQPGTESSEIAQAGNFSILVIDDGAETNTTVNNLRSRGRVTFLSDILGANTLNLHASEKQRALIRSLYYPDILTGHDVVIVTTPDFEISKQVSADAAERNILVSYQTPQGRSADLTNENKANYKQSRYWKRVANISLFTLASMLLGHLVFSYIPLSSLWGGMEAMMTDIKLDEAFAWMVLAGFVAQLVDGALGMGYGVMSTTILLSTGLNPAAISGSIHTAEMFSSGASGYSHYRFGNINKKLFKTLLIPGVIGAVVGATLLAYLGEEYANWIRPILSVYTLLLGTRILFNAFKAKTQSKKVKRAGWLAGAGGFLDSFGGGGWGPLVTSTLISKGKTPRFVIGTVSLTEFFVTFGSAVTFFIILGTSHVETIIGLIVGGLIAAPIAARLAGKLPAKTMLIGVGTLVIFSSLRTLIKVLGIL